MQNCSRWSNWEELVENGLTKECLIFVEKIYRHENLFEYKI